MTRKLLPLNLILAALLGATGWQIRQRWIEERDRQEALLRRPVMPQPVAPAPAVETVKPIDPPSYTDVATKMVFAKDRNPNVILEAPPPPPPPPPVPPFPVAFGLMDFGGGATVFLAETATSPQKSYRAGDKVGPFKLSAIKGRELTFEWEDKTFVKTMEDLKPPKVLPPSAASAQQYGAAPQGGPAPQQPVEVSTVGHTLGSEDSKKKIAEAQQAMSRDGDPGVNVGGSNRACSASDTSPPGTVQGGFRKVVRPSMFGQTCFWEPVR